MSPMFHLYCGLDSENFGASTPPPPPSISVWTSPPPPPRQNPGYGLFEHNQDVSPRWCSGQAVSLLNRRARVRSQLRRGIEYCNISSTKQDSDRSLQDSDHGLQDSDRGLQDSDRGLQDSDHGLQDGLSTSGGHYVLNSPVLSGTVNKIAVEEKQHSFLTLTVKKRI
ncbi:hypothetical protein M8J77_003567 [Diaphorina citri]|nr:hypothetical protein M8J77_003567 [Diaphorina citri]